MQSDGKSDKISDEIIEDDKLMKQEQENQDMSIQQAYETDDEKKPKKLKG